MAEIVRARPYGGTSADAVLPLLVAALSGGLLAQAGFYARAQWYLGLLVCAAALVAALDRPPARADLLAPLVLAGGAFAGWALAGGAARRDVGAGGRYVLLVAGLLAAGYAARALGAAARATLLNALLAVGAAIAATGWLGVLLHRAGWAWQGEGLWRAAATLTYPNAAAAVLAMLALAALAHAAARFAGAGVVRALVATVLLAGLGATLSRGGVLGFVAGWVVLAVVGGPRRLVRVTAGPAVGALVVVAGLVPSMRAGEPARPVLAVAALLAGLVIGAAAPLPRWTRGRAAVAVAGVLAVVGTLAASAAVRGGLGAVAGSRATAASPDRTGALRAAWQVVRAHPLTGAGPGLPRLDGGTEVFRYAHNEYVQVLAELGVPGLVLLLAALTLAARALVRARHPGHAAHRAAALAACTALAVHAGLDFLWHLPAIPLLAAVLAGLAMPEPPGGRITERGQQ